MLNPASRTAPNGADAALDDAAQRHASIKHLTMRRKWLQSATEFAGADEGVKFQ
jgi:hypothetical protein